MSAGYANRTDWPSTAKRLAAEHHRIVDAVEQGDTSKAADNIADHLTAFYEDKAG
jgi:DNA-binding GntR family transcriptional regulator